MPTGTSAGPPTSSCRLWRCGFAAVAVFHVAAATRLHLPKNSQEEVGVYTDGSTAFTLGGAYNPCGITIPPQQEGGPAAVNLGLGDQLSFYQAQGNHCHFWSAPTWSPYAYTSWVAQTPMASPSSSMGYDPRVDAADQGFWDKNCSAFNSAGNMMRPLSGSSVDTMSTDVPPTPPACVTPSCLASPVTARGCMFGTSRSGASPSSSPPPSPCSQFASAPSDSPEDKTVKITAADNDDDVNMEHDERDDEGGCNPPTLIPLADEEVGELYDSWMRVLAKVRIGRRGRSRTSEAVARLEEIPEQVVQQDGPKEVEREPLCSSRGGGRQFVKSLLERDSVRREYHPAVTKGEDLLDVLRACIEIAGFQREDGRRRGETRAILNTPQVQREITDTLGHIADLKEKLDDVFVLVRRIYRAAAGGEREEERAFSSGDKHKTASARSIHLEDLSAEKMKMKQLLYHKVLEARELAESVFDSIGRLSRKKCPGTVWLVQTIDHLEIQQNLARLEEVRKKWRICSTSPGRVEEDQHIDPAPGTGSIFASESSSASASASVGPPGVRANAGVLDATGTPAEDPGMTPGGEDSGDPGVAQEQDPFVVITASTEQDSMRPPPREQQEAKPALINKGRGKGKGRVGKRMRPALFKKEGSELGRQPEAGAGAPQPVLKNAEESKTSSLLRAAAATWTPFSTEKISYMDREGIAKKWKTPPTHAGI